MVEKRYSYCELARKKVKELQRRGKLLLVLEGDILDKLPEAQDLLTTWFRDGDIDSAIVSAQAVLHEVFDRSKSPDVERLLGNLLAINVPIHLVLREPCAPTGWPPIVYLSADCSNENLHKLAMEIRRYHTTFQHDPEPQCFESGVRLDPILAVETITKLFYIDDLPYEIEERVTSLGSASLTTYLANVLGGYEKVEKSMSLQTESFNKLWKEYKVKAFGTSRQELAKPELHKLVYAKNAVARGQTKRIKVAGSNGEGHKPGRKGRGQITATESVHHQIDDTFKTLALDNLTTSEWRVTLRTLARKLPTLVQKSASTQGRKELEIVNDILMFTRAALKGDSPDPITLAREQLSTSFKVAWVSVYPPLDVVDGFYGWYRASREALISNSQIVFFQRDPTYVDLFRMMLREDPVARERVELREHQNGCQVWCVSPIAETFPGIQTVIWNPGNLDFDSPDRMRVFVNTGGDIRLIQDAQKERFSLAPDYALKIGELEPLPSELMWQRLNNEYQRFVEDRRVANLPIPLLPVQITRSRVGSNARKRLFQE